MCGIYMLDQGDGNTEYIMGPVFTGESNNYSLYSKHVWGRRVYKQVVEHVPWGASPVPRHSTFASELWQREKL